MGAKGVAAFAGLAALAVAGCEPANVTEARNQIGRGPARTLQLAIPIRQDTFSVSRFFNSKNTVTRTDGLLAVKLDPDSVNVRVGEQLRFDNVGFDQFSFSFPAVTFTGPAGTSIGFNQSYAAIASEARLLAVDTVVIESGTLQLRTQNRLPITMSYSLTLNGFRNAAGATLTASGTLPPATGDGTYTTTTVPFNLAGVTLLPGAVSANLAVTGTLTGAPINGAVVGPNAIIQTGSGSLVVRSLAGRLDPTKTPELIVSVENFQEVQRSAIDFGEFEKAIRDLRLNDAVATLTIRNSAQTPVQLSGFALGVVQLDAAGQLRRTSGGAPDYEKDAAGTPIRVTLADPGAATHTIGRATTTALALPSAALIDRLVHLVLDNKRVAVVAAGTARAGDGLASRITRADVVGLVFSLTVGLDFTLPDTGVVFRPDSVSSREAVGLDAQDADDLAARVVTAQGTAVVTNGTPFGVTVESAIVEGAWAFNTDVFALPGSSMLTTVTVAAGVVDPVRGQVTEPTTGTATVSLTPAQVRLILGDVVTSGLRIRIRPGTGSGGRGALRSTDRVIVDTRASLVLRSGNP